MSDEQLYLEYFNNYLTLAYFAERYWLTLEEAQRIIDKGRAALHTEG